MVAVIRTCCACGARKEKRHLNRFVWRQHGVIIDDKQQSPGRGAYCCPNEDCLERFYKNPKKWKKLFRQ